MSNRIIVQMTTALPKLELCPQKPSLVCCVIVNWNGWQDTVECLQSLIVQDYNNLDILVVDNASSNDSVQRIRATCPNVQIIEAAANLGFSAGCNIGVREALKRGAEFIWLLNNDTIAPPDTLTRLIAAAQPNSGVIGTVLRYLHDPRLIQAWGGGNVVRWLGYVTHFTAPTRFGRNTYLTFASVLIRKEVFLDIGLLDERYFMYFDDSDFCFRARTAGWQLTIAPDTAVLHKEGGSTNGEKSSLMERIVTTSGLRFLRLHSQFPPIAMTLFVLSKFAKRILRGDLPGVRAVTMGVSDWWHNRSTAFRGTA
jgi:GT2 family glycosyltransferase